LLLPSLFEEKCMERRCRISGSFIVNSKGNLLLRMVEYNP
jgi:hypothetical protein